ncbi:unnamed protein product [Lactuca saligna]|uniref:GRF-type domain-containing protein n=1 Tax=Lactuca saligna TaxID=75948 RepID=A0AA35YID2_LACSI|nr:unnamed protein product [Lactuca saligna]
MASSSSVGSRSNIRSRRQALRATCFCEDPVGKWTSWRPTNPDKRFIGCPNFRDEEKDCKYFAWVDPPLPNNWYRNLLMEFHNNDIQVHNEFAEEFVEEAVDFHNNGIQEVPVQGEGEKWEIGFFFVFVGDCVDYVEVVLSCCKTVK